MTKKRPVTVKPWAAAIEDILADGEWHDGRAALIEGMKRIEPGVAVRAAEQMRRANSDSPSERVQPISIEEQIRVGKRRMMTAMLSGRLRGGTWESDPPYPLGSPWTGPGFKLRDVRSGFMTVPQMAEHCQVPVTSIEAVLRESSVIVTRRGTNRLIAKADLETFSNEVKAWVADGSARRAESTRRAMRTRGARERNLFTPTSVAAIESVLGHDPDTPAVDRLRMLVEQAREAEELRSVLWVCRDELARLLEAQGGDEAATRVVDAATRALDLTGGLFPKET